MILVVQPHVMLALRHARLWLETRSADTREQQNT